MAHIIRITPFGESDFLRFLIKSAAILLLCARWFCASTFTTFYPNVVMLPLLVSYRNACLLFLADEAMGVTYRRVSPRSTSVEYRRHPSTSHYGVPIHSYLLDKFFCAHMQTCTTFWSWDWCLPHTLSQSPLLMDKQGHW